MKTIICITLLVAGYVVAEPVLISADTVTQAYLTGKVTHNEIVLTPTDVKVGIEVYKRADGSCFKNEYGVSKITRVKINQVTNDDVTFELPHTWAIEKDISCPSAN